MVTAKNARNRNRARSSADAISAGKASVGEGRGASWAITPLSASVRARRAVRRDGAPSPLAPVHGECPASDHRPPPATTGAATRRADHDAAPDRGSCRRDRKSVVSGKSVSVRVDPGGRRHLQKKKSKLYY